MKINLPDTKQDFPHFFVMPRPNSCKHATYWLRKVDGIEFRMYLERSSKSYLRSG